MTQKSIKFPTRPVNDPDSVGGLVGRVGIKRAKRILLNTLPKARNAFATLFWNLFLLRQTTPKPIIFPTP